MRRAQRIGMADVVRFGLVMGTFGAAVRWSYRHPGLYGLLAPVEGWTAGATRWLLAWSGIEVERAGTILSHPGGFACNVGYRCTGLVVAAFLAMGLLALPLGWRTRARGLIVGVPLVLAANLARLVSLFYVGVHRRDLFDVAHLVLWELAMVLVILGVWIGCAASRGERPPEATAVRVRGASGLRSAPG